jgi:lambda family phage portal protein
MSKNINVFERSIALLSPAWAASRAADRMRFDILTNSNSRSYDAGRNYRNPGWNTHNASSANSEIGPDLVWLRGKSSDLVRNNPFAKKAVQVITTNVVGTGIRASIRKKALVKAQETKLMTAWRNWAETTDCDFNGQKTFYGLQALGWKASVERGDAFFRIIRQRATRGVQLTVPIKLQLLEADYLDHQRDGEIFANGNYCVMGIEFDGNTHQRVAYWMYKKHPNDMLPINVDTLMSVRIPANEIIHWYEILRPGQVRGIPHGVASFLTIKDLDDYADAQLKRQKIAASFAAFIKKTEPGFADQYDQQSAAYNKANKTVPNLHEKIEPGAIEYLLPGEDVTFANPPGTTGYDEYTTGVIRSIACGYLVTYESISGDYSKTNFSSGRLGFIEANKQVGDWQSNTVIPMMLHPVWKHFFKSATLAGLYSGPFIAPDWTAPKRDMIDPYKEAKGYGELLRMGVVTKAEIIREFGDDPERVFAEIDAEQKEADAAGMMLLSDPKWDPTRVNFGKDVYLQTKTPVAPVANPAGDKPVKVKKKSEVRGQKSE